MSQLITLTQYRKQRFIQGSTPDLRTLKRCIENGEIRGKQIGRRYYVEVDQNGRELSELEASLFNHG